MRSTPPSTLHPVTPRAPSGAAPKGHALGRSVLHRRRHSLRGRTPPARFLLLAAALLAFSTPDVAGAAADFPSTGAAWVLPGAWEMPTDRRTRRTLPDAAAVREWELANADVAFGGDYGADGNARIDSIAYLYNQKIDFNPSALEQWLRGRAGSDAAYEQNFLHFTEDTVLAIANPAHSSRTPFARRPWVVGWTADLLHAGYWLYQQPPWDVGAWEHAAAGGALFVLLSQPFDEITLDLSTGAQTGRLRIDYPSAVDADGLVSGWSELEFVDGSENLSHSGILRWTPPSDWQWAALHDGSGASYGHGQFFGQEILAGGGRAYAVRLSWVDGSGTAPRLANVSLRDWMPEVSPGDPSRRTVPGWDPANDANSDGYVDDGEFAQRPNPNASARMAWESRAVPLGRMWNESSNWCSANLFRAGLRDEIAAYHAQDWTTRDIRGGYNDDLFKTVGASNFEPLAGGAIAEHAHPVGSTDLEDAYAQRLLQTLSAIGTATGSPWITANVSAENLFTDPVRHATLEAVSALLREGYLHASQGLTGYFGLMKAWDVFAAAHRGTRSIVQVQNEYGRARLLRNKKKSWDYDREALLAQYYLVNVPGSTYVHFWDHSFQYGSGNTARWVYARSGVPKNLAYQPTSLLLHDIGAPTGGIPEGYEPMDYMVRTSSGGDYTVIGNSLDTELVHPELLPNGSVPVTPSGIFYLQRAAGHPAVPTAPLEAVLARTYTKGMVVYRTDMFGASRDFMTTRRVRVELPGRYRRLHRNGRRLGKCSSSLTLRGYEGAILVADPKCD